MFNINITHLFNNKSLFKCMFNIDGLLVETRLLKIPPPRFITSSIDFRILQSQDLTFDNLDKSS